MRTEAMYLIGIDLGTTGCKSMVFDEAGTILGEHYIEYDVIFLPGGGAEQDANIWWDHTVTAVRGAIAQAGIDGSEVGGLSVSAQGCCFVPVDEKGLPLANAISWYDTRALPEARALYERHGAAAMFHRVGRPVESLVFPELIRLKRLHPDLYEKTWKFLMPHDYLICRLSGAAVTDYSMASGSMCYDVARHAWASDLLEEYGIDERKLPELRDAGTRAGTVTPETAALLGISPDAVVAVGMQDQKIAALGAGIGPGRITVSLGTASAIETMSDTFVEDPACVVPCHSFDSRLYTMETIVDTAGSALKWAKNTVCPELGYREMDALAAASPCGANGVTFYPFLCRNAAGVNQGGFRGIGLETTRGDLIRAVLEGVACGIRSRIEEQKALLPHAAEAAELMLFGGGSASPLWRRIIADVTGMTVRRPRTQETGNLGAAICAGVGAGVYRDLWDGQRIVGEPSSSDAPDPANRAACEELYARYCALREEVQK